jgi:putative NIF3 family GTP cyclohydrolase 1 type 2
MIETVALCPGSGDSLLVQVRQSSADVYVTSDLRHHPVAEHREAHGCPLIDINHVAAEAVWLPVVSAKLSAEMSVEVALSAVDTRAWINN